MIVCVFAALPRMLMMKKFNLFCMVLIVVAMVTTLTIAQDGDPKGPDPAALKGLIAFIGEDYNVYTIDPATQTITALTDDATATEHYQWPTWANDGRLAYFCCDIAAAREVVTEVFVSADGLLPGESAYLGNNQVMTYAAWAPADCAEGAACRELSVLLGGAGEFDVQIIQANADGFSDRLLGSGAPFYVSWSPDGAQMLLQRGNTRYDVYDVATQTFDELPQAPGFIQAPQWSPVDDRLLIGVLNPESFQTDIVIIENFTTVQNLTREEAARKRRHQ